MKLYLNEIFDHVLTQSGQFIIDADCIELNVHKFRSLTKLALSTYSKYNPYVTHLFKDLNGSRQYTFDDGNTPEGVPDYISDIVPARVTGLPPFFLRDRHSAFVESKTEFPWIYRKPTLTVTVDAKYDITAVYRHKLKDETVDGKKKYYVDTLSIENDESFFDLLTGRFLKGLGRSRRAFTMDDLPITSDSADLVSDGEQMEKDALEEIRDTEHDFYLAWR